MIKSTSYYLRYKEKGVEFGFSFSDHKTLVDLEKQIKKFIDDKITFEVWVRFNFQDKVLNKSSYGFYDYTSFEIWYYDADTDTSSNYNLRKNIYYKRLRRYERRLSKTMLTYGLTK